MVVPLSKDLKKLIEQIEAWPSVLPPPPPPRKFKEPQQVDVREVHQTRGGAGSVPPPPTLRLTSSLAKPPPGSKVKQHQLPSMASVAPQRAVLDLDKMALSPDIGPGTYDDGLPRSFVIRYPGKASPIMMYSARARESPSSRGRAGQLDPLFDAEDLYAHSANPRRIDTPAILGASPFMSLANRFGPEDYQQHLRYSQQPRVPRRPTAWYHGAPRWDGPFVGEPMPVALPADHRERLVRARAEGGLPKADDSPEVRPDSSAEQPSQA